jgi:hypothetical protein
VEEVVGPLRRCAILLPRAGCVRSFSSLQPVRPNGQLSSVPCCPPTLAPASPPRPLRLRLCLLTSSRILSPSLNP